MKFATYFDKKSYPKVKGTINNEHSLTDQSFKAMCEIEQLLMNYQGTPRTPVYDLDNYETANWTFEDWQNEKAKCERKFLNLTPEERERFANVQEFFKFCSNPDNYELIKGLYQEKKIIEEPAQPVVEPTSQEPPQA